MLLLILTAVIAGLLAWLALQVHQRNQFWAKRGVPHDPPHLLLGNFSFVFKKNVGEWMRDLHARFHEPLVGIWVFWRPVLVVADPDIARRILIQDSDLFRNRSLGSGKTDPIGSLNLFTVNDPLWTNVRRRLTYIFTGAKLKAQQGFTCTKAKELVQRIKRDTAENKFIETRSLFSDLTTDVFGTFALGIENNAILSGDSPIRAVSRDFMKYNWFRGCGWYSIIFWSSLVDIFGFSLFPKESTSFFSKTVLYIIAQRSASNIEKNDLLDALMKMKKEGLDEGEEVSDDLLVAQACIMLQGAFDTSAVAMTMAVHEMAHNPDIQERLYREIVDAKEEINGAEFDFSSLEKLTYLNAVIKEGLRKYPPMGWLDRAAASDYKINDRVTILKGNPVYVNAIGMHYDPKFFPDPYVFNPDRFLPENESNIVPFSYLPFGDGPRICIGQRFSQMTMRFTLCELVLAYQFRPTPGYPKPNEVKYETKGLFLMPGEPLTSFQETKKHYNRNKCTMLTVFLSRDQDETSAAQGIQGRYALRCR